MESIQNKAYAPKRKHSSWFAFYPGDFICGTLTMPPAAIGAYLRLLCSQWESGHVPGDERAICRITGMFPEEWNEVREMVLAKFTAGKDGNLRNDRLEAERAEREGIREKRVEAGKAGANARWNDSANGKCMASAMASAIVLPMATTTTTTSPSLSSTTTPKTSRKSHRDAAGMDPEFDGFWKAYPKKIAKGGAAKSWTRTKATRPPLPELLEIIESQKRSESWTKDGGKFIPHPATWLNETRWLDELDLKSSNGHDPGPCKWEAKAKREREKQHQTPEENQAEFNRIFHVGESNVKD